MENMMNEGLQAVLDSGVDVTTLDRWENLVDNAHHVLTSMPTKRDNEAQSCRKTAEVIRGHERGDPQAARFFLWVAEMYHDPPLARRLIDCLPESARQQALLELDQSRRPFPISVVVPVMDEPVPWVKERKWYLTWQCDNCGEQHEVGDGVPAVVIGYRPGWSVLDDDAALTYCAGCITIAGQVASGVVQGAAT